VHHEVCEEINSVSALVGIGLGFLLNLFAYAIGLSVYNVDTQGEMM